MPDRAGYDLVVYCIDVSPSMGELKDDPGGGKEKTKLDLAKEYVARKCEPKVSIALPYCTQLTIVRSQVGERRKL